MIYLTSTAYQKIKFYTLEAEGEISGLGKSKILDKDTILITDIIILEQTNSSASTDLDEEAMAKFLNQKMKNNEEIADWNVWWHSHADMNVFWSLTDDDTIENTTGGSYLISIVINKRMEALCRLDMFKPIRLSCQLPISKSNGRPKEIKQYLKKICQGRMNKCVINQIDTFDNVICLTPTKYRNPSPLLEPEISDRWPFMD